MSIGVLCSGGLGFSCLTKLTQDHEVKFVLTDSLSLPIINFCDKSGIPFFNGNPRKGRGYTFMKSIDVDVIVSVNYLFIIDMDIVAHAKKLAFNVHGSLLPKYRGRTPHVWSIINGESETGITAHRINEGCDTGDVIKQIRVKIDNNDTGGDILAKFEKLYYPLISEVLTSLNDSSITYTAQNNDKASFFGKRTPDDGLINWAWKAHDIRNWVRAQSSPYPGAFSYCNNDKLIIDKVSVVECDNRKEYTNGEIIEISPRIVVKCGQSAVSLDSFRETSINFEVGNILTDGNSK